MAFSHDAFDKFRNWMRSKALLKLTVIENDEVRDAATVQIAAVDEDSRQVSFVETQKRPPLVIDFNGALFQIGSSTLEATRPTVGRVVCEEIAGKIPPHQKI